MTALTAELAALLRGATVIPAHPLALTPERRLDERRQRALTRYYLAAGAGGVAVAVHTTQFEVRRKSVGLLAPVLELASCTLEEASPERPFLRIAGACGDTRQAVAEAELAAAYGFHAVLLSPSGLAELDEFELLARTAAVGEVLPVIGFYLQSAVGGRQLSRSYWRQLAELESVVAVKVAPFDRYRTVDTIAGVTESSRADDVVLYTGNDDNIILDLLVPLRSSSAEGARVRWMTGGLLGQWAVWTHTAVRLMEDVQRAREGDHRTLVGLLARAPELTEANAAVFDAANGFRGCIPGVHEVLRRQGLLAGTWCLSTDETLSPGQGELIAGAVARFPWLTDDKFVEEHRDAWLS